MHLDIVAECFDESAMSGVMQMMGNCNEAESSGID